MDRPVRWLGNLALVLFGVIVGAGCAHREHGLLLAPEVIPPEPPFETMVAQVDGTDWHSTWYARASEFPFGEHTGFIVAGYSDSVEISLLISAPRAGTYVLDGTWEHGSGLLCVLTPDSSGWDCYPTIEGNNGTVTVTRVDSTEIAGHFRFDAFGLEAVHHVRNGAFRVPVTSGFEPGFESLRRDASVTPHSTRTIPSFIDFACSRSARVIKTSARQGRATSRHCKP